MHTSEQHADAGGSVNCAEAGCGAAAPALVVAPGGRLGRLQVVAEARKVQACAHGGCRAASCRQFHH